MGTIPETQRTPVGQRAIPIHNGDAQAGQYHVPAQQDFQCNTMPTTFPLVAVVPEHQKPCYQQQCCCASESCCGSECNGCCTNAVGWGIFVAIWLIGLLSSCGETRYSRY